MPESGSRRPASRRNRWICLGVVAALIALTSVIVFVTVYGGAMARPGTSEYGLKFEPNPNSNGLILIHIGDVEEDATYVYRIESYLSNYQPSPSVVDCRPGHYPQVDQVCAFPTQNIAKFCREDLKYGYIRGSPCVLIYAHMPDDWVPATYNYSDMLPENMPEDLQKKISDRYADPQQLENAWMSCQGEDAPDVEYMGPLDYYPDPPGFPAYNFPPKRNVDGYMDPVVAVRFSRPNSGVAVRIRCRIWTKNASERDEVTFVLRVD